MWTSTDPADEFWCPYSYANNPIMFVDPDGMKIKESTVNEAQLTTFTLESEKSSFNNAGWWMYEKYATSDIEYSWDYVYNRALFVEEFGSLSYFMADFLTSWKFRVFAGAKAGIQSGKITYGNDGVRLVGSTSEGVGPVSVGVYYGKNLTTGKPILGTSYDAKIPVPQLKGQANLGLRHNLLSDNWSIATGMKWGKTGQAGFEIRGLLGSQYK